MNTRSCIHSAIAILCLLQGCKCTEHLSPGNMLDGRILAVTHGIGGFGTYRNTLPPNTVAALERELTQGPDGIELDVQLSADSQLVVFHDELLDRATTCMGRIRDQRWETLQDCQIQTRNGPMDGIHRLSLLDTLLAHIHRSGQHPYVFINPKHDPPCIRGDDGHSCETFATLLVESIHRHGLGGRVVVESMVEHFLQAVHPLDSSLILLFDDEDFERGMKVVRQNGFIGLCISNGIVSKEQVDQAHSEGYWLGIWGVHVLGDTRKAVEKCPELIMTDDLLMLRAALKE
ncbi:MAG: hypothetical protein RLZZ165_1693 [Bacteroidota bacterium]|jgi:glycerophosphoryl diester phosphodiesterase